MGGTVIFLLTEKKLASRLLVVLKHENETVTSRNEQKALQELVAQHNKVTDEVVRTTTERLENLKLCCAERYLFSPTKNDEKPSLNFHDEINKQGIRVYTRDW